MLCIHYVVKTALKLPCNSVPPWVTSKSNCYWLSLVFSQTAYTYVWPEVINSPLVLLRSALTCILSTQRRIKTIANYEKDSCTAVIAVDR